MFKGDICGRDCSQRGATMIEYCFLALLILLICTAGVAVIGQQTEQSFKDPRLIAAWTP